MKFIRFLGFLWLFVPCVVFGAGSNDFQTATQLLTAARRGDVQTVRVLINSGANVNYVDSTGMSLVCTAVMNNDKQAIQILQAFGADASKCDRQIKSYKQRSRTAARGEEYNFFSGLSSSHVVVLSAIAVAGVIGGVALLTKAFEGGNNNKSTPSGGSHSGGGSGGGSSSSTTQWAVGNVPISPASLDANFDVDVALNNFILAGQADFDYLKKNTANNFQADGLNANLQNYLLIMHGYHSLVNGYLGQYVFRDSTRKPIEVAFEGKPVKVALITGNGVNPAGSIDSANNIEYLSMSGNTSSELMSKYFNTTTSGEEIKPAFDLSGSGSVFNPFADVNDSALAKIVAGWESNERSYGDLYGFAPNAQLAILRTGNGYVWQDDPGVSVGTWNGTSKLKAGDTIKIGSYKYTIANAIDETTILNPTVTVGSTTYRLATNSKLFLAQCVTSTGCTSNIAIYVGSDGYWYVNSTGGNDIDAVYSVDSNGDIYVQKTKQQTNVYSNFEAMSLVGTADVIANVDVLDASRSLDYLTAKNFAVAANNVENKAEAYKGMVNYYYGADQGVFANGVLSGATNMILMPAGEYVNNSGALYLPLDATFENYAPLVDLYSGALKHNFMTIVAVGREEGTSAASNVADYETNTNADFGRITLSSWKDSSGNNYSARSCGITGVGSGSVDPWCFAAAGPTAEMATAAAAGAVASIKSAFDYMNNDQVFTLLALTADGPFLSINTYDNNKQFTKDTLKTYLNNMYDLPYEHDVDTISADEYLAAFQNVFGYGLINLERAITPGKSVYYFSDGKIVSASGDAVWRAATTGVHSSNVLALNGRKSIKTSYYDVLESVDGSLSMPRVWNDTYSFGNLARHGLYMGDVLGDFDVDSTNKRHRQIGKMSFDMAMSQRAYNDSFNGLDDLRVAFSNEKFDIGAQYQHYFTDGESRFNGRSNGVLGLVANTVSSDAKYKIGKFAFGGRAFYGNITDETLLETDPVVSSQFEPGKLGLANGGEFNAGYNSGSFGLNTSFGVLHETNTVLGMMTDGLLNIDGANTQYVDVLATYKPIDKVKLSLRGTFASTNATPTGGIITELSNIKSNAFALGADIGGFSFTASMPLATVDGKMGYDYAEFVVVENNGEYEIAMNDPHVEYLDLSAQKREMRFSASYKQPIGEFTDAGVGLMYRVNPGNVDLLGNESILMFKLHHRLGI